MDKLLFDQIDRQIIIQYKHGGWFKYQPPQVRRIEQLRACKGFISAIESTYIKPIDRFLKANGY